VRLPGLRIRFAVFACGCLTISRVLDFVLS